MKKYKCDCCGYYTLFDKPIGTHEICEVCFWSEDDIQRNDPNYKGGENAMSLNEARETYKRIGVISKAFLQYVRPPLDSEKKGLDR